MPLTNHAKQGIVCGAYLTELGPRAILHLEGTTFSIEDVETKLKVEVPKMKPREGRQDFYVEFLNDSLRRFSTLVGVIFHMKGILFLLNDNTYLEGSLPIGNVIKETGTYEVQ